MATIFRWELADLLIYLQREYGLYLVEFRKTPGGRKGIILSNPDFKDWWVEITPSLFYVTVFIDSTGINVKDDKHQVIKNILNGLHHGYSDKHHRWKLV